MRGKKKTIQMKSQKKIDAKWILASKGQKIEDIHLSRFHFGVENQT